ncbi:hypothetical protein [Amycolatopsis pigmentata]|uniref:AAA ATPase domain-containing protein n=1 Tax=Amycolatopsis pigmentata TaxID=450801 RepID=A0ABW5G1Z6_9PSEU
MASRDARDDASERSEGLDPVKNPYHIPGMEAPDDPLCPYLYDHEKYYVKVDSTQDEFDRFQRSIGPLGGFRAHGRLVVVTGKDGCGKTSLINRCAAWLSGQLGDRAQIFPLAASTLPHMSLRVRMEQVLEDLIYHLSSETSVVSEMHVQELDRRLNELRDRLPQKDEDHHAGIETVYKYLLRALPSGQVGIIILPRSELGREIASYVGLARLPRLVFFAESRYGDDVRRSVQAGQGEGRPPLMLEVGPLNRDDGWLFANARQGPDEAGREIPLVTKQTMGKLLAQNSRSIKWLHALLYGVYKEFDDVPEVMASLKSREVTYEHFTDYFFRTAQPDGAS